MDVGLGVRCSWEYTQPAWFEHRVVCIQRGQMGDLAQNRESARPRRNRRFRCP